MSAVGISAKKSLIIQNIYENDALIIRLHKNTSEIRIARGVRQGDTISPKLFTVSLESTFRRTNWEGGRGKHRRGISKPSKICR